MASEKEASEESALEETALEETALEETVVGLLKKKKMTLSLAESCTGGAIAADIVNDIRSFCYGPSRDKLNQMVNMMAMVQMLQLMNQPADGEKEDSHE